MSLGVMETEPKWYVLHTFTNYENIAKENLKLVIENFGLHDRIFDIVIPPYDYQLSFLLRAYSPYR